MDMHDPSTWSSHVGRTRRFRWHFRSRWGRKQRQAPCVRVSVRYRRRLAAIERGLVADAPTLSSKFAVFNQLTDGEQPVGAEQVPRRAWSWLRSARLTMVLILAAIVALCAALSTELRAMTHPCPAAVATRTSTDHPVHDLLCRAYPTAK